MGTIVHSASGYNHVESKALIKMVLLPIMEKMKIQAMPLYTLCCLL